MLSALFRWVLIFLGGPQDPCDGGPGQGDCEHNPQGPYVDPNG